MGFRHPQAPADRQRDLPPVRKTDHHHHPTGRLPPGLVPMATHSLSPRPHQPLPHPRRQRTSTHSYITFPGWTTNRESTCVDTITIRYLFCYHSFHLRGGNLPLAYGACFWEGDAGADYS